MKRIIIHYSLLFLIYCFGIFSTSTIVNAQSTTLESTPLPLDDLSSFKQTAGNWQIVGEVIVDRNKKETVSTRKGKGILVTIPSDKKRDNLFTNWEHADIELDLEFMMPKGSNSGIYLQGRYEIQLFDSWGVQNPKASDAGGIYERWDESKPEGQKGFEGHPPRYNVSRAPGLWQQYTIVFQAPRFDQNGRKTANARFVKVVHNGVVIHENVELSGPTRSAAFTDEKAMGPLMIQGDHGPVALRNIRYKKFDKAPLALTNVRYSYYEGKFEKLPDFTKVKAKRSGNLEEGMSWTAGDAPNDFAFQFTGNLQITEPGDYRFELASTGASRLLIDNKTVIDHDNFHIRDEVADGKINLSAGPHVLVVHYSKNVSWFKPALGLFVEGPGIRRQALHGVVSLPDPDPVGDIQVTAQSEPLVLRSFVEHNGKKKTECVLVGEPAGLNYAVDLAQGSLLKLWKGEFVDATAMWHSRGETQLAKPMGSVIQLTGQPTFARLPNANAAWPDSMATGTDFQFKSYKLDAAGRPVFNYILQGTTISDYLVANENQSFVRELTIENAQNAQNLYCRVAEGKNITQLPDGSYGVNDMQFYVEFKETNGAKPVIREVNNRKELLLPVSASKGQAKIRYAIIW
jgi:hypothetical protein